MQFTVKFTLLGIQFCVLYRYGTTTAVQRKDSQPPNPSSLLHPSPWQQPWEFSSISLSLPWLSLDSLIDPSVPCGPWALISPCTVPVLKSPAFFPGCPELTPAHPSALTSCHFSGNVLAPQI